MNAPFDGTFAVGLIGLSFPAAVLAGTLLSSAGVATLVLVAMWVGAFAVAG